MNNHEGTPRLLNDLIHPDGRAPSMWAAGKRKEGNIGPQFSNQLERCMGRLTGRNTLLDHAVKHQPPWEYTKWSAGPIAHTNLMKQYEFKLIFLDRIELRDEEFEGARFAQRARG